MKYYRVKQDNFLWKKGAILKQNNSENGYVPISDVWDNTEVNNEEYITTRVVEAATDWFERVYEVNLLTKTVYKLKEEAQAIIGKEYQE